MTGLTDEGQQLVDALAARYNVGTDAVLHLLRAVAAGGGRQAQFNHPDLGGMGQWSQGGMIMVGDMFNQDLKYRVDALCNDLAQALDRAFPFAASPAVQQSQSQSSGAYGTSFFSSGISGASWPVELGTPSSTGSQNNLRYAVFPSTRRLAIDQGGRVTVYDTGDHWISGFSQQQSGDQSLTFTSQHGLVRLQDLPVVTSPDRSEPAPSPRPDHDLHSSQTPSVSEPVSGGVRHSVEEKPDNFPVANDEAPGHRPTTNDEEIFTRLERLAELCKKGVITQDEFLTKKTELLARL